MGMDLAALTPLEEAQDMTVMHPETGAPLLDDAGNPMTIGLYGQDSEAYKRVVHANQNRRLAKVGRAHGNRLTAEQLEAEALEVVVACTARWSGIAFGGPLECTPSNARRLYGEVAWLREQVEAFIGERGHFFGNSKPTSSPSPSTSSGSPAR